MRPGAYPRVEHLKVKPRGINNDPTVWLDVTISSPKYVYKNDMILENLKV
jgi:hypothetical protein